MDVILHLTHDCQLDCVYCYGGRKRACAMSWEVAQRAIDLLFDQPQPDAVVAPQLGFFGGEPLLELLLLKRCVAHAKARSEERGSALRMAITTNGLGLDDATAEYLARERIEPTLSFDGVAPAHNACRPYRDGSSSFEDTQEAMLTLSEHFPGLTVCAVVSPENVQYLADSVDFFVDAGIRRIMLNPNFFAHWDERHLDSWRQGYEHAGRRFEQGFRERRVIHVNFITAKIVTHLRGGYQPCECCDFGLKEIAIAPGGNIYPCQRMVGEDAAGLGLMGNVLTGFIETTCRDLAEARQVTSPECQQCRLRPRCRNWCSCVNHRLTGRFDRVGPLVCFHERMAIEVADRAASRLFAERNRAFMETFYSADQIDPEWV